MQLRPQPVSKVPMRVLWLLTLLTAVALLWLVVFNSAYMFLYSWAYFGLIALGVVLILSMIALTLGRRVRAEKSRRTAFIVLFGIVGLGGMVLLSVCLSMAELFLTPVGQHTSPGGKNRAVVLRSMYDDQGTYFYNAYPMADALFYIPDTDIEHNRIITADLIYRYEWVHEDLLRVYQPALDEGEVEQSIYVDFSALDASTDAP